MDSESLNPPELFAFPKLLKFKADRRTLVFVAGYFTAVTVFWNLEFSNRWMLALAVGFTAILSWTAAVITHNTLHAAVFYRRGFNRIFQALLTVTYGFPVSEYVPGHNLSHHRFTQKPEDVMRTTKVQHGWNLLNFILFVPRVAGDVTVANFKFIGIMKGRSPAWYRQYLIEVTLCWGSKAVLLALDWRKALLFIFLPHAFALWGITAVNYLQHDGCDEDHEFNHSRNFMGRLFNWWTFNNGFHGMHHRQPGLHWSLLPAAHFKELHSGIHPALEQKSLAIYLFKTFVYPGKRMRYDGLPLGAKPEEALIRDGNFLAGADFREAEAIH